MMSKITEPGTRYFDADAVADVVQVLGIPSLSSKQIEQLETAARNYVFVLELELKPGPNDDWQKFLLSKKEKGKALKRVAKAARALKSALADRALMFLDEADKLSAPEPDQLEQLAKQALEVYEKPRSDAQQARIVFVELLADIFEDVTPRLANRRHDPYSSPAKDYGPFLDFCRAALTVVVTRLEQDPEISEAVRHNDPLTGLDRVVRTFSEQRSMTQ